MNKLVKHISFLMGILLFFFSIQFFIFSRIGIPLFYPIWNVFIFHFLFTIILLSTIYYIHKIIPNYTGFIFLGGSILQMLACILFLLPLISHENFPNKIPDVLSFFIPYFICLIYEVIFSTQLLLKSDISLGIKD